MYVAPTPFDLLDGVAHQRTLILPEGVNVGDGYVQVGRLIRREADRLLLAYSFDLRSTEISTRWVDNPAQGTLHRFVAVRLTGDSTEDVSLRATARQT
jgi:hypothetical protein